MKTEDLGIVSLLSGTAFLSLGMILTYLELWPGQSLCMFGPASMLLSLSYVKYKVYAKYFIPILFVTGTSISVLGWFLLPPLTVVKGLTLALGMGILMGGVFNFIAVVGGKPK